MTDDLIIPAINILGGVKDELNHALSMIYNFVSISTRYQNLIKKHILFRSICMDAVAMLEISTMSDIWEMNRMKLLLDLTLIYLERKTNS